MSKFDVNSIISIVTHPGQAHRDDFLGVCVALATCPNVINIFRREPTTEELDSDTVMVLDVGGRCEPERANFDHHQFSREAAPVCALTLLLDGLDLLEEAMESWLWLGFTELLDSKGPFAVGKRVGETLVSWKLPADVWQILLPTLSPVESFLLRRFGDRSSLLADEPGMLMEFMSEFGWSLMDSLIEGLARMAALNGEAYITEVCGLKWVDASFIDRKENPTFCLERWTRKYCPDAAGTITQDDRGDGLSLFRRNDHARVDFSMLEGKPGVIFAHKNGFVAKLAPGADVVGLIQAATIPF